MPSYFTNCSFINCPITATILFSYFVSAILDLPFRSTITEYSTTEDSFIKRFTIFFAIKSFTFIKYSTIKSSIAKCSFTNYSILFLPTVFYRVSCLRLLPLLLLLLLPLLLLFPVYYYFGYY